MFATTIFGPVLTRELSLDAAFVSFHTRQDCVCCLSHLYKLRRIHSDRHKFSSLAIHGNTYVKDISHPINPSHLAQFSFGNNLLLNLI